MMEPYCSDSSSSFPPPLDWTASDSTGRLPAIVRVTGRDEHYDMSGELWIWTEFYYCQTSDVWVNPDLVGGLYLIPEPHEILQRLCWEAGLYERGLVAVDDDEMKEVEELRSLLGNSYDLAVSPGTMFVPWLQAILILPPE